MQLESTLKQREISSLFRCSPLPRDDSISRHSNTSTFLSPVDGKTFDGSNAHHNHNAYYNYNECYNNTTSHFFPLWTGNRVRNEY